MNKFKKYRRTNVTPSEMRDLENNETKESLIWMGVSISEEDLSLDHDEFIRGKIARNPKNPRDMWYVSEKYFHYNFELIEEDDNEN